MYHPDQTLQLRSHVQYRNCMPALLRLTFSQSCTGRLDRPCLIYPASIESSDVHLGKRTVLCPQWERSCAWSRRRDGVGRVWLARVVDGGTLDIGNDGSTFGSSVMCCGVSFAGFPGGNGWSTKLRCCSPAGQGRYGRLSGRHGEV